MVGGMFRVAGSSLVHGIAWYDAAGNDWRPFGSGVAAGSGAAGWILGSVSALLALPNGDLVAGGSFPTAGGSPAANIAVWTNGAWAPLGAGMNGEVQSLARLPNGAIVAGGSFTTADGAPANHLAVWNGTSWSQYGGGLPGAVTHLAVLASGELAAAGPFGVRTWNGAWTTVGVRPAHAIAAAPTGGLIWSSSYTTPIPSGTDVPFVAATVGGTTSYLLTGAAARAFEWLANGDLLAALDASAGPTVQRWDGTAWTTFAPSLYGSYVYTIARMPNGDLLVGGSIDHAGSATVKNVAAWDGQAWRRLGEGFDAQAHALAELPNGDLVLGGAFGYGVAQSPLARWNGSQWTSLGPFTPVPGEVHRISALATLPNGDLVAGGSFSTAGGGAAANVARFDGTSWWSMGSGVNRRVDAMLVRSNGHVVVGTDGVFGWNGTAWSPYGTSSNGFLAALAEAPNGDVVAAGSFTTIGGVAANRVARWTGAGWQPLGGGTNSDVLCVAVLPNGDLIASGWFTTAGSVPASCIARWDGVSWSPLGSGLDYPATSLLVLPNGDVLAAGWFITAGGAPAQRLARWDGAGWSPVGGGLDDHASAMRLLSTGEIGLAGRFTVAGGLAAGYVAKLEPTCPADTVVSGVGCTGAGGANVLVATTRPWIGSTFRARATGLAPNSLALGVVGFGATAVPLPAILPQGVAGCSLLATPDLLDVWSVVAGTAATQLSIPNVAAFVGQAVHHQVVAIELDASGTIVALTSTNALRLTFGSL